MNREGEEAAVWGYDALMTKWNRKHNKAVYIPSQCVHSPERKYWYGNPDTHRHRNGFYKVPASYGRRQGIL